MDEKDQIVDFAFRTGNPHIIKVIGVGGGGGNAVNHMYQTGIHDVSFVVCNTDAQALDDSPVQFKVQLGSEGLGAGNIPEKARHAAEESIESIDKMLSDGTKMVFITAGMGGGTGTGAAPIIAREAKSKNILTIGIVTIPFQFEGNRKIDQALDGVEAISKNVDALLVVNNERLREIYPELTISDAFGRADDTLTLAARSIAEIITTHGKINLDFNDVCTVLRDGGVAIMSTGKGEGELRVKSAIDDALNSPLLNNNDIFDAKKVLLYIYCSDKDEDTITMEEMNEVHDFMSKFGRDFEVKWGIAFDPSLGKQVKVTVLASGFGLANVPYMEEYLVRNGGDESEQAAQAAEEEEKKAERRKKFGYEEKSRVGSYRRPHHVFRFNDVDVDNDDIISMVEQTPTAHRSSAMLRRIYEKNYGGSAPEKQNGDVEQTTDPSTIKF
ncbi:MAG: cell division protein FtsZ [Bacteroidaceae bacterium]|nr:cell division protein FtsZ [Prevotellaceae bacterium]MDY4758847.1 cell division protein FtsZ [Bacteroidaceae bacterium]